MGLARALCVTLRQLPRAELCLARGGSAPSPSQLCCTGRGLKILSKGVNSLGDHPSCSLLLWVAYGQSTMCHWLRKG